MADSKVVSGAEATSESQDSQKTVEYSLESTNDSPPKSKTEDNCPDKDNSGADSQEEEMDTFEQESQEDMEEERNSNDISEEEGTAEVAQSPVGEANGSNQTNMISYCSLGPSTDSSSDKTEAKQPNSATIEGERSGGENKSCQEPNFSNTDSQSAAFPQKDIGKSDTQKSSNESDKSSNQERQEGMTKQGGVEGMEREENGSSDESTQKSEFPDPPIVPSEPTDDEDTKNKKDGHGSSIATQDDLKQTLGDNKFSDHTSQQESKEAKGGNVEDKKDSHSAAVSDSKNKAGKADKDSDSEFSDDDWGRPWASRDTEMYRNGYPGKRDDQRLILNYEFYTNKVPSKPDGDLIDEIHKEWKGDYDRLEWHHGYIQWLFPIRESGMNWHAQELQLHEIEKICADTEAHRRVLTSYEMMLDFYGMRLKDHKTGELERAENWQSRFSHLNHSMHNYLRITRILKCLGEFKYDRMQAPFVEFVLEEAIVKGTLKNTRNSCFNYWLEVVKNDGERKRIRRHYKKLIKIEKPSKLYSRRY